MSVGADCGAVGNMEVEKCWRAQVNILGGRSCVRWISCEFGVRKVATGERKGGEEEENTYSDFRNLRREASRGTVREIGVSMFRELIYWLN